MTTHEDEDIRKNCEKLLKFYNLEDKFQKQFVSCFKRQDYEKCQELLPLLQKPHQLVFDREDVNKLLAYHYNKKGQSKLKDFLMSFPTAKAVLHDCDNLYKFEMYAEDILSLAPQANLACLQSVKAVSNGKIQCVFTKPNYNQKQIGNIVKKQKLVESLAK